MDALIGGTVMWRLSVSVNHANRVCISRKGGGACPRIIILVPVPSYPLPHFCYIHPLQQMSSHQVLYDLCNNFCVPYLLSKLGRRIFTC